MENKNKEKDTEIKCKEKNVLKKINNVFYLYTLYIFCSYRTKVGVNLC